MWRPHHEHQGLGAYLQMERTDISYVETTS